MLLKNNKLISFYKLDTISSIIDFLRLFSKIKKFQIEVTNNNKVIIDIQLSWYYIWPFTAIFINNLRRQIQFFKPLNTKIIVRHMNFKVSNALKS